MNELFSPEAEQVQLDTPSGHIAVQLTRLNFDRHKDRIDFQIGSYRNKALVDLDGEPLFGELAILRLAELDGWEGAWVDTYHQGRCWNVMPHLGAPIELPTDHAELLERIRSRIGTSGGAWDVIAWKQDQVAFFESKGPGDALRPSQLRWLGAAVAEGLDPSSFILVEWTLTGEANPSRQPSRTSHRSAGPPQEGLPTTSDFERALPAAFQSKLKSMGMSPVMDNTLRRVRAGARTYPSRVKPTQKRELVSDDGGRLTDAGNRYLDYVSDFLDADGYPPELLQ